MPNLRIGYLLFSLFCLMVCTSCADDNVGEGYGDSQCNMVTYKGFSKENGLVFVYQGLDDAPSITLEDHNVTDSPALKTGQRILLTYVVTDEVTDNLHTIRSKWYNMVNTDTLRVLAADSISRLAMEQIKLLSVWRTGEYLNIRCEVQYEEKARGLTLVTDGTYDAAGTVGCKLMRRSGDVQKYYWGQTYMSYYIGSVWNDLRCRKLSVMFNDLSYPDRKNYEFIKKQK